MKKILFVFVLGAALTSCKKNYTCLCTEVTTDSNGNTETETSTITVNNTKKNAKNWCKAYESTSNFGSTSSASTCELK